MKRKYLFFIILFLLTILFYQQIVPTTKEIFNTLTFSFIPSLLPALFLTNIFLKTDGLIHLYKVLNKNKFTKLLYMIIVLIICLTIGTPSILLLCNELQKKNIVNKRSYLSLVSACGGVSFPFLYGITLLNLNNKIISIIILFIFLLSSIYGLIESPNLIYTNDSFSQIFKESIFNTTKTLLIIAFSVLLFSIPLFILERIKVPYNYIIEGLIEFSYPTYKLSKLNTIYSYYLILFFSLFPSLSIIFQIKIIDRKFKLFPYLIKRFFIVLIAFFMFSLIII